MNHPVLQTRDLTKTYWVSGGLFKPKRSLKAVNGVSLEVERVPSLVWWENPAVERARWRNSFSGLKDRHQAKYSLTERKYPK